MDEYIGIIKPFAGNFAPVGWMMCNGQLMSIAQYTALFSILGTTYGGDGISTFALPNLQSRVPIGMGQGPGLSYYAEGQMSGQEKVNLVTPNIPAHIHQVIGNVSVKSNANAANADTPEGAYFAPASTQIYNDASAGSMVSPSEIGINLPASVVGGNIPVPIMNPFLAMNFIICVEGYYPPHP